MLKSIKLNFRYDGTDGIAFKPIYILANNIVAISETEISGKILTKIECLGKRPNGMPIIYYVIEKGEDIHHKINSPL